MAGSKSPRESRLPLVHARAKRDWSKTEFFRACRRNGIQPMQGGMYFIDRDGRLHDPIYLHNSLRVARRATLAKILREQAHGTTSEPPVRIASESL